MNSALPFKLIGSCLGVLLFTPGTLYAQSPPKQAPSDTLKAFRLDANAKGSPIRKEIDSLSLPEAGGKQDKSEQKGLPISKTVYDFLEPGDYTEVSDRLTFNAFKIHFYSDVSSPELTKELENTPLKLSFPEFTNGAEANVDLVKFSMTSGLGPEGGKAESDSLAITTTTLDKQGKPYSYSNTLTGSEEEKLVLGGTIPRQAIEFTENGASGSVLSDVVIIDPIRFRFESDTETTSLSPDPNSIKFKIFSERLKDATAFSLTIHSAGEVPEGGTLSVFAIGVLGLGWRLRRKSVTKDRA